MRRFGTVGIAVALTLLIGAGGYMVGVQRNALPASADTPGTPKPGTTGESHTSPKTIDRSTTGTPETQTGTPPTQTGTPPTQPVTPPTQPVTDPFWNLISETRRAAGKDTGTQSELLRDRLSKLSPPEILAFERWWRALDRRLYTWQVWGAAFVIQDGCSDDCFRDFRAYVISLGPDAFRVATKSPDALAPIVSDDETGDWEGAKDMAPDAFSMATDGDFPLDTSDLSGTPRGVPWSDNQGQDLIRRYPRLASRFR
jgi:hypothetical protein